MNDSNNPTIITAQPGSPFIDVLREFAAAPARVFRAWIDPELLVRWLGPRDLTMELTEYDARSGGGYGYLHRDAAGHEHRFRGVFHTVTADERIIQTFEWAGAPGEVSLDDITFESVNGRTRLRTHTVFPSVQARDAAMANGMSSGISESMDRLGELVEEG